MFAHVYFETIMNVYFGIEEKYKKCSFIRCFIYSKIGMCGSIFAIQGLICDVNDQVNLLIMMEIAKLFKICSHCDDDQDIVTIVIVD